MKIPQRLEASHRVKFVAPRSLEIAKSLTKGEVK